MSQSIWNAYVNLAMNHPLLFAVALAAIFGLIYAALGIDSAVRAGIRRIKNERSERSVLRLRKRIAQLEQSRELYNSFILSDKALYLLTFQIVLAILLCGIVGTIIFIFGLYMWISMPKNPNPRDFFSLAILPFAFAAGLCAWGLKITALNTRAKVSALVEKLDSEIADLKTKLDARTTPP